eukprot:jgi/Mesvir1/21692/Mv04112-RA.1
MAAAVKSESKELEAEAFRRIYPEEFLERFLAEGIRPDGRPLGRGRLPEVTPGAVTTTDGSALVKIGNTTVIAGVKLQVCQPDEKFPRQGRLEITLELPPLCAPDLKPGKRPAMAYAIGEQLKNAVAGCGFLPLEDLLIAEGKSAWLVNLDLYCLDHDGGLLDAAVLATVSALRDVTLPAITLSKSGLVGPSLSMLASRGLVAEIRIMEEGFTELPARRLQLGPTPYSLTCGLYSKYFIVDPTSEEEVLLEASVTVIITDESHGHGLVSVYKPGGAKPASTAVIWDCIEAAKMRVIELAAALDQAFPPDGA